MNPSVNRYCKKYVANTLLVIFLLLGHASILQANDKPSELVILNWTEYLDPALVEKFEKQYNAKIKEIYYESDDYRDNYMLETQGKGIDIIVMNGIMLRQYKNQEWIGPLTEKDVPNLKHIDKKWITMFEGSEGYAMPYFWGTIGIAYRKDLVKSEVSSWKHLFYPDESLHGKIAMLPASRDLIGMALKLLGYSVNSTSFRELEEAKQVLLNQKPYINGYEHITLGENSSMMKGEILMTMTYSGDALMLMDANENIDYIVPKEGTNFWVDYMTVGADTKNRTLAYQFINFLNEPAHAAQLAEFVYYATPNKAAEKLLPDEFKSDEILYPSQETLDKSEVYTRLPPRVTRVRNEIFIRVTE